MFIFNYLVQLAASLGNRPTPKVKPTKAPPVQQPKVVPPPAYNSSMFYRIHPFVAKWEGGFVNHPSDPGGATNYGVSLRWLRSIGYDVDGDGDVDIDDIKALTPNLSKALFKQYFWDNINLNTLPQLVAACVYDGAINMGASRAIKQLQAACNNTLGSIAEDGKIGQQTAAHVQRVCQGGVQSQLTLCVEIITIREQFYKSLAAKGAFTDARTGKVTDYRPFLAGWLNRTRTLLPCLQNLAAEGV